jgi:tryptophanyl-tRNA synthetase
MTADILIYQASIVPVGEDQAQHLELARDIAQRFNSLYGETFVMPATHLPAVGARIMGLDDPTQKMSKSAPGSGHAIALLDDPKTIQKKIARATTDSNPAVDPEKMGPGIANLLTIARACDPSITIEKAAGMRYGDFKKLVAETVIARLEPIQRRYREVVSDQSYVDKVLERGKERVLPISEGTMRKAKQAMGLYVGP